MSRLLTHRFASSPMATPGNDHRLSEVQRDQGEGSGKRKVFTLQERLSYQVGNLPRWQCFHVRLDIRGSQRCHSAHRCAIKVLETDSFPPALGGLGRRDRRWLICLEQLQRRVFCSLCRLFYLSCHVYLLSEQSWGYLASGVRRRSRGAGIRMRIAPQACLINSTQLPSRLQTSNSIS